MPGNDAEILQQRFPFIVVGAGLAGLSSALKLCQKGHKVLVLEQDTQIGGYAINFRRGKYRFEGSLHHLDGCELGGAFDLVLKKLRLRDRLEFLRLPNYKQIINIETNQVVIWPHYEEDITIGLCARYPDEAAQIRKFFKKAFRMGKMLLNWTQLPFPAKVARSFRHFGLVPYLMRWMSASAKDLLDHYFSSDVLKKEILGFPGFSKPQDLSAIVFFSSFFEQFLQGSYYPKGGSAALAKLLADETRRLGGTILLRHSVERINVVNKQVMSLDVRKVSKRATEGVWEVPVENLVYCGDLHALYTQLVTPGFHSRRFIRKLLKRKIIESVFVVYLGLDINLRDYGFTDFTPQFVFPGDRECNAIIYSNLDSTCCPEGHSNVVLMRYMAIDPFVEAIETDGGERGEAYKVLKQKIAEEMIADFVVATEITNLTDHIAAQDAATPYTFHRYTSNYRGSISGFALNYHNSVRAPLPSKTPLKNLFIGGQWTGAGGGYILSMLNGIKAAKLARKNRMLVFEKY